MPKLSEIPSKPFEPYNSAVGWVVAETGTALETCTGDGRHTFWPKDSTLYLGLIGDPLSYGPCWCKREVFGPGE